MKSSRIATFAALITTLIAPVACTEGGSTGPVDPPPPPGPAPDLIQTVTVRITGFEVTGSCDHDSIFESSSDGEFSFFFDVTPSGSQTLRVYGIGARPFSETTHDVGSPTATFNRNITRGEDFRVVFEATEFDGILGADGQYRGRAGARDHRFSGGSWGPGQSIELNGSKANCGTRLHYEISTINAG